MNKSITRINVVGTSGSGKSILARALSKKLHIPYKEIDALFWKADWAESSDDEFLPKLKDALSGDGWVLDGNFGRTASLKWERVQAVVWLDLPLYLVLYRVIRRTIVRYLTREVLWASNREKFRTSFFSRKSIIWWSLTTHHKNRACYLRDASDPMYSHIDFIRLRSKKDVEQYLSK